MIDVEKLLEQYQNYKVRRGRSGIFVTVPFFLAGSDESIALRFSEAEDGRPVITDCGTTIDYLLSRDINVEKYRPKLNAIMQRFGLRQEDGAFVMTVPTTTLNFVKDELDSFIQAISVIANIDL